MGDNQNVFCVMSSENMESKRPKRDKLQLKVVTRQYLTWINYGWSRALMPGKKMIDTVEHSETVVGNPGSIAHTRVVLSEDTALNEGIPVMYEILHRVPKHVLLLCRYLMGIYAEVTGKELMLFIMFNLESKEYSISVPEQTSTEESVRCTQAQIEKKMSKDLVIAGVVHSHPFGEEPFFSSTDRRAFEDFPSAFIASFNFSNGNPRFGKVKVALNGNENIPTEVLMEEVDPYHIVPEDHQSCLDSASADSFRVLLRGGESYEDAPAKASTLDDSATAEIKDVCTRILEMTDQFVPARNELADLFKKASKPKGKSKLPIDYGE